MTHLLEFSFDQDEAEEYRRRGEVVSQDDPELWVVSVKCQDTRPVEERDCRMWIECGHTSGSECSASPNGHHKLYGGVGRYWSSWCWAEECDETGDKAIELIQRHNLSFGSYSIVVNDTDENYIEFALAEGTE